uniref:Uncharacterized protein n=1 Tax=Arundo donax TaxID=35708 RepID=A0A0A9AHX7_ARUDO
MQLRGLGRLEFFDIYAISLFCSVVF